MIVPLCIAAIAGCMQPNDGTDHSERHEMHAQSGATVDVSKPNHLEQARRALAAGRLDEAELELRKELLIHPNDVQTLIFSGRVAEQQNRTGDSITFYQQAVGQLASPNQAMLDQLTIPLVKSGRVFDAIAIMESYLERFENSAETRMDLAGLATMVGMPELAIPSLQWLFLHNQGNMDSLMLMANPNRSQPDLDYCTYWLKKNRDDMRLRYPMARVHANEREWKDTAELLSSVVERHREFTPAVILYARALVELNRLAEVDDLISELSNASVNSPKCQIVRGKLALARGQYKTAAEAFLKVEQLSHANESEHLDGLYRSLVKLDLHKAAEHVEQTIAQRVQLRDAFNTYLGREKKSQMAAFQIAEFMVELGRIWEAEAWARHATTLRQELVANKKKRYLEIRSRLKDGMPWVTEATEFAELVSLDQVRNPMGDSAEPGTNHFKNANVLKSKSQFPRFSNESEKRGFQHTCKLSADAESKGHWLHQSSGGGVAVLDFDLDSNPDIVVANLDGQPMQSNSSPNGFYRNIGERFTRVGVDSGYIDSGFSQGFAIGDVNSDGFDDIFDANIGQNRLFINNGDGTFRESAEQSGLIDQAWTVSAAIADLDGDGIADIFAANYCDGAQPFTEPCFENERFSACAPLLFNAQHDNVYRGNSDGSFTDVTNQWIPTATPGRGLGVVVANLDERPGLDVYVANDMTANHFWSASTAEGPFHLSNLASVRGLAVNAKSQAQASMGIALGDADDDGDFDLYLTHFSSEYHTYYEQTRPGFWQDRSHHRGLAQPTIPLLGFGTQWCDFDNDGAKELIVANGHVDDSIDPNVAYRMPAQVFRRALDGQWEEFSRERLGGYFENDHLGRALAIADLDCDGRVDALVTHLYEPVALLMNRTAGTGNSVRFSLKGIRSHRDAIGAKVTVVLSDRSMISTVTAGDGYMCSNERRLSFGVGGVDRIAKVLVQWPSGEIQTFSNLSSNAEYLFVEGADSFMLAKTKMQFRDTDKIAQARIQPSLAAGETR